MSVHEGFKYGMVPWNQGMVPSYNTLKLGYGTLKSGYGTLKSGYGIGLTLPIHWGGFFLILKG